MPKHGCLSISDAGHGSSRCMPLQSGTRASELLLTSRISVVPGNAADVNDVSTIALNHSRGKVLCDKDDRCAVSVDHGRCILGRSQPSAHCRPRFRSKFEATTADDKKHALTNHNRRILQDTVHCLEADKAAIRPCRPLHAWASTAIHLNAVFMHGRSPKCQPCKIQHLVGEPHQRKESSHWQMHGQNFDPRK